ncbi:MAG: (d)CMP kinase [Candidatus Marinimicrobia bacterium]|jgi:cytidylate kinase|nr:(d)CMP kinase [Candidatus Neomarinimicrobiota bacterium]MDD9888629.1 (d)CMP kinase [Candidatus Neomarinimicrobiota bacterium]MDD9931418.1 (d)CMP kinase [Candidatus Neomarinimicrobiota bacterium]
MIVAIDGPAATGKSTSAKLVAHKLGFTYLDTGAMYRCVTLSVLRHDVDLSDSAVLAKLLSDTHIEFGQKNGDVSVSLNGENVSREIRQAEVTNHVSAVSALASVREALVRIQRQIAANQDCVLEGRDIGTIVFPDADIKFFLIADDRVRAERRQLDLNALGENKSIEELMEEIRRRDKLDSERDHSPLRKADDAVEVDTTQLTINEQVDFMVNKVKSLTIGN